MSRAIILFLDCSRGHYIPRDFAQSVRRDCIRGVSLELLDSLAREDSVEGDFYWDDWHAVLDNAKILHDGAEYTLHHDDDLWLINYELMTDEEKRNFGFED